MRNENAAIQLRPIGGEDLDELAGLFQELTGESTDRIKMAENFRRMQANPDYILLGAQDGNELVGSLMGIVCLDIVGECRPFIVVENVIVAERSRGRGVGRRLMAAIEAEAVERGCLYIMFVSSASRKEAHRFYEAMGYGLDVVQGFKKFLP